MTKMIKVTCPSCKMALSLPEQQLKETDGRADCHHCGHVFRLVKKKKAAAEPTPTPKERVNPDPIFKDVGASDPIFPTDDFPTGGKSDTLEKAKQAAKSSKKSAFKLNYREPKANANKANHFTDIGQNPLAFNMLDANTANAQIPQVSIKPAVNGNNPSINTTGTPDQQNNITIHTDSLVFTLVGDNANDGGVIDAGGNKSNAPIVVSSGNDLNWTIATIAALIVLIVQLFYLVLMLQ